MSKVVTEVVDAALEEGTVQVSSLRKEPHKGWIYLRLIENDRTLRVSLSETSARELARLLEKHAERVEKGAAQASGRG